jgi:hypothetical protein
VLRWLATSSRRCLVADISFSVYENNPSQVFIETLEDEFFMFSPESKELFEKAPWFERAYRILMERHLAVQNRLFETIAKKCNW